MNVVSLFSKETVNNGRQPAVDLCKTVCIILMLFCHVFYVIKFTNTPTLTPSFIAHNLVRLLGAQFFMFSMGLGLAYTRNDTAKCCLRRGVILLLSGYMLNFLREILPWMLFGSYPMFSSIMSNDKFLMLLNGDILQFAGLAFLFFAFVKHFKMSNLTIFMIAIACTAVGAFCTNEISVNLSPDNFYFSFVGLFIPIKNFTTSGYVCFSFCNWILYPVTGWLFGKLLKRCNNPDKFYLYMLCVSVPVLLLAWSGFDAAGKNMWMILMNPLVYHQQNPIILAVYMNIIAVAISIAHLFSNYFVNSKLWGIVKHLSTELPTLYIASWVVIGWIGAWLKMNNKYLTKNLDNVFLLFVVVLLVSEAYIYIKNLLKNRKTKQTEDISKNDNLCYIETARGVSAVGSARHWQCRGQGFESPTLHKKK